jgi:hypothetical protein
MSSLDRSEPVPGTVRMRRVLMVAGCGVLTVTGSACESTEQESAKIGREGRQLVAGQGSLKLGAANHSVRVSRATLLNSAGRTAVAVQLTGTSTGPQANVPLLVDVTGAGGKVLYSNETGGLEESLQRIALLRPHQGEWWVDDQVLTSQPTTAVKVRVGTGSNPRSGSSLPSLATSAVHVGQQAGISVVSGNLVNHSNRAQSKVPVFAVAVRRGQVVAAGRAVVGALPGHAGASVPFQVFLVGNPTGATIELTAVPTAA